MTTNEISIKYNIIHENTKLKIDRIAKVYNRYGNCGEKFKKFEKKDIIYLIKSKKYNCLSIKLLRFIMKIRKKAIYDLNNKYNNLNTMSEIITKNYSNVSLILVVNWLLGFSILGFWMLLSKNIIM